MNCLELLGLSNLIHFNSWTNQRSVRLGLTYEEKKKRSILYCLDFKAWKKTHYGGRVD